MNESAGKKEKESREREGGERHGLAPEPLSKPTVVVAVMLQYS